MLLHLMLMLIYGRITVLKRLSFAYRLDVNEFRGQRNAQLLVEHIWPC